MDEHKAFKQMSNGGVYQSLSVLMHHYQEETTPWTYPYDQASDATSTTPFEPHLSWH
jgi:hypothetical protein